MAILLVMNVRPAKISDAKAIYSLINFYDERPYCKEVQYRIIAGKKTEHANQAILLWLCFKG